MCFQVSYPRTIGRVLEMEKKNRWCQYSRYRLIGLESGSFLLRHYKITQRWAKVFLKALVERNSVMVVVFYMISIPKKYDQKHTI